MTGGHELSWLGILSSPRSRVGFSRELDALRFASREAIGTAYRLPRSISADINSRVDLFIEPRPWRLGHVSALERGAGPRGPRRAPPRPVGVGSSLVGLCAAR